MSKNNNDKTNRDKAWIISIRYSTKSKKTYIGRKNLVCRWNYSVSQAKIVIAWCMLQNMCVFCFYVNIHVFICILQITSAHIKQNHNTINNHNISWHSSSHPHCELFWYGNLFAELAIMLPCLPSLGGNGFRMRLWRLIVLALLAWRRISSLLRSWNSPLNACKTNKTAKKKGDNDNSAMKIIAIITSAFLIFDIQGVGTSTQNDYYYLLSKNALTCSFSAWIASEFSSAM